MPSWLAIRLIESIVSAEFFTPNESPRQPLEVMLTGTRADEARQLGGPMLTALPEVAVTGTRSAPLAMLAVR